MAASWDCSSVGKRCNKARVSHAPQRQTAQHCYHGYSIAQLGELCSQPKDSLQDLAPCSGSQPPLMSASLSWDCSARLTLKGQQAHLGPSLQIRGSSFRDAYSSLAGLHPWAYRGAEGAGEQRKAQSQKQIKVPTVVSQKARASIH